MKHVIISMLILLFVYSNNYTQWTKRSVGGESWGVATTMDVSSDGILSLFVRTSNLPRRINISYDYGTIWHKYNTTNEYDGTCISSADSGRIWFCTDDGKIFNSIDTGKTWTLQYYDSLNFCFFDYIRFFDKDNGIAIADADTSTSPMKVLKTTDGGKNWISVNSSYLIGESAKDVFYQISFPNASTGYFSGFISKKLHKTTDGGVTWPDVNLPTISYDISVVSFYDDNLGFIVCWENFQSGSLYRTNDGGKTWNKLEIIPQTWLNDIEFLPSSPDKIWFSDYEKLYFSSDTGNTWTEAKVSDSQLKARNIEFLNDSIGFLLCDESNFYVTVNNGGFITDVEENYPQNIPSTFSLKQNYPNPFNPSTKIRFVIPNEVRNLKDFSSQAPLNDNVFVTLKVYDILGREVATLVNEQKPAGNYEVNFDASDLSSGIYFYRIAIHSDKLQSGSFVQTRKMILMK